jgi:hypothetical protein
MSTVVRMSEAKAIDQALLGHIAVLLLLEENDE